MEQPNQYQPPTPPLAGPPEPSQEPSNYQYQQSSLPPRKHSKGLWIATRVINYSMFGAILGFLLLIDVPILISTPSLADFFYYMLASTVPIAVMLVIDEFAVQKYRALKSNGLDKAIFILSIYRNSMGVLNVIPLIQLIALLSAPLWIMAFIAEVILRIVRFSKRSIDSSSIYTAPPVSPEVSPNVPQVPPVPNVPPKPPTV